MKIHKDFRTPIILTGCLFLFFVGEAVASIIYRHWWFTIVSVTCAISTAIPVFQFRDDWIQR